MLGLLIVLLPTCTPVEGLQVIIVSRMVVGTAVDGKWSNPSDKPPAISYPATFHLVGLGKEQGTKRISSIQYFEETGGLLFAEIEGDVPGEMTDSALALRPPAYPRAVQALSNDSAIYMAAVKNYLATKGLRGVEIKLNKVLRVDLDGNGTQEVLIEASNTEMLGTNQPKVDYWGVMLRFIDAKGKVQMVNYGLTIDRGEWRMRSWHKIAGVADLDGDGMYEVIIASGYYEGDSAEVRRFETTTTRILCGWGAGA